MLNEKDQARVDKEMTIGAALPLIFMFIVMAFIVMLIQLKIERSPHAIAKIERVWDETIYGFRSEHIGTMAELTFTRIDYSGKSVICYGKYEIGDPDDGYRVGEQLDIVPDSHGCRKIRVVGRAKP